MIGVPVPKNFTRSAANDSSMRYFPRQMGFPQGCKSAGKLKVNGCHVGRYLRVLEKGFG